MPGSGALTTFSWAILSYAFILAWGGISLVLVRIYLVTRKAPCFWSICLWGRYESIQVLASSVSFGDSLSFSPTQVFAVWLQANSNNFLHADMLGLNTTTRLLLLNKSGRRDSKHLDPVLISNPPRYPGNIGRV